MFRRTVRTPEKRKAFLDALRANGGVVRYGCDAADISRDTAYRWKAEDPEFAADWDQAFQEAIDGLERECHRRATEGTEKPVYHQGQQCGTVREYSDTLAIFLLKGRRPEVFRDRVQQDVNLKGEVTIDDVRGKLAAKLDALADRGAEGGPDRESHAG